MADLLQQQAAGDTSSPVAANIKATEDRLDELNARLEGRRQELVSERECTVGDIRHLGRAWVLPHPERATPGIAPMVRDDEIERIAVEAATAFEQARGWEVESVESENRGFDLISRQPGADDPAVCANHRFIEVKGRAGVGEVALSMNEYKTAARLGDDFWLYVVYNCATSPEVHAIRNPARLRWEPLVKVEHYSAGADQILGDA